jgi:hypothetical protein
VYPNGTNQLNTINSMGTGGMQPAYGNRPTYDPVAHLTSARSNGARGLFVCNVCGADYQTGPGVCARVNGVLMDGDAHLSRMRAHRSANTHGEETRPAGGRVWPVCLRHTDRLRDELGRHHAWPPRQCERRIRERRGLVNA